MFYRLQSIILQGPGSEDASPPRFLFLNFRGLPKSVLPVSDVQLPGATMDVMASSRVVLQYNAFPFPAQRRCRRHPRDGWNGFKSVFCLCRQRQETSSFISTRFARNYRRHGKER